MAGPSQKTPDKNNEEKKLRKIFALALEQYNWNGLSTMELRIFIRLLSKLERTHGR
ncbi:MAG: hypothetical protein M0018_03410 [Nitrospiraceae bacterium]|nr:hypothetical protein [Nitrospiraceae bacterium]